MKIPVINGLIYCLKIPNWTRIRRQSTSIRQIKVAKILKQLMKMI